MNQTNRRMAITLVNIYAPNIEALKHIKKISVDFKEEIDSNTVTAGNFHTLLSLMDRSSRQKINKKTVTLNYTLDQINLIDIYSTFHPKAAEYAFFLSAHGSSSEIDHIVGEK